MTFYVIGRENDFNWVFYTNYTGITIHQSPDSDIYTFAKQNLLIHFLFSANSQNDAIGYSKKLIYLQSSTQGAICIEWIGIICGLLSSFWKYIEYWCIPINTVNDDSTNFIHTYIKLFSNIIHIYLVLGYSYKTGNSQKLWVIVINA